MESKIKYFIVILVVSLLFSNFTFPQTYIGESQVVEENGNIFVLYGSGFRNKVDIRNIIIKYENNTLKSTINSFESINNLQNDGVYEGYYLYKIPTGIDYISYCQNIQQSNIVEDLELSLCFTFDNSGFEPNDESLEDQWYLDMLDVPEAWMLTTGSEDVVVAVLDWGLEFTDEEFGPVNNQVSTLFHNTGEDTWDDWTDSGCDEDEHPNCLNDDNNGIFDSNGNLIVGFYDDWQGLNLHDISYSENSNGNWTEDYDIINNNVMPYDPEQNGGIDYSEGYSSDDMLHGTWMASIIGGKTNNGEYTAGIAGGNVLAGKPGVKILPIKMTDWAYWNDNNPALDGWYYTFGTGEVIKAIRYAREMGVDVINMSFGVYDDPHNSNALDEQLIAANNEGIIMFASVGNENYEWNTSGAFVKFPASDPRVIAIGAVNDLDDRWDEGSYFDDEPGSNQGWQVELMAPGTDIEAWDDGGLYGTSFSTAMASATAALMRSVNPDITVDQMRSILRETAFKKISNGNPFNLTNDEFDPPNTQWDMDLAFGRINTLHAVCAALELLEPMDITQNNEIWDEPTFSKHDIIIEPGAKLTLTSTLMMDPSAKIIVKPGAEFIVDGGTITNLPYCAGDNLKWRGIEVWGDPSKNQDPLPDGSYYQGYLELKNNATIENAQTAVALRKEDTWAEFGGGIVKATETQFINNAKSVHFAPYQNMFTRTVNGQTLEFEMLNECSFELCNFEVNENYFDDSEFFKHADIVQVHRIPFLGCNFSVSGTESASTYNTAIAAYSAGVNVNQYDNENPSTFTGFYCAVLSNHSPVNEHYSIIRNANFTNNSVGIRNTGTNNFKIIDNHFEIGENNGGKGACGWAPGYGIDLREATGFVIENNSFVPVQGNSDDTYGVRIFETHTTGDDVYKNTYNGLTVANLSDGINAWNSEDKAGLSYLCNLNNNNGKDFLIDGLDPEIFINQGSASMGAGNTFSSTATMHLENTGTEGFNYYKFGTGPDPTKCTPPPLVNIQNASGANTCPDHYGGSGGGIGLDPIGRQAKEDEFNDAKTNYNAVESLYASLTDGGDTEGTELTIAAAQSGDTWELRANLLGMSPYLSKEVLIEAADKTDVLPESVLFEILSANPDELKKGDLMEHLENKEEPLPDYMIEILKQMAAGTTAKTALLSQMGEYKSLEISIAKEIIHSILIEDELDHEDLRTWLANLESYNGDRQIISSFIAQSDISSAQALMDMLPELYELNGDALSEHNEWADLMNMQLNWQAEGRNPTDLTEAELATLYNLADNGGTKAKYQARGILEHFYGENYIDCCTPPDGNKSTVADFSKNDLAKAMGLSMEANPNPAKEYTEFSYTLPFGVEYAILNIFEVSGKLIEQMQLNSPINKLAYNTLRLPAGSYTIEIKTNDYSYSTKLIVQ